MTTVADYHDYDYHNYDCTENVTTHYTMIMPKFCNYDY